MHACLHQPHAEDMQAPCCELIRCYKRAWTRQHACRLAPHAHAPMHPCAHAPMRPCARAPVRSPPRHRRPDGGAVAGLRDKPHWRPHALRERAGGGTPSKACRSALLLLPWPSREQCCSWLPPAHFVKCLPYNLQPLLLPRLHDQAASYYSAGYYSTLKNCAVGALIGFGSLGVFLGIGVGWWPAIGLWH